MWNKIWIYDVGPLLASENNQVLFYCQTSTAVSGSKPGEFVIICLSEYYSVFAQPGCGSAPSPEAVSCLHFSDSYTVVEELSLSAVMSLFDYDSVPFSLLLVLVSCLFPTFCGEFCQ